MNEKLLLLNFAYLFTGQNVSQTLKMLLTTLHGHMEDSFLPDPLPLPSGEMLHLRQGSSCRPFPTYFNEYRPTFDRNTDQYFLQILVWSLLFAKMQKYSKPYSDTRTREVYYRIAPNYVMPPRPSH
jgi:hypothetical protein